MPLTHCASIITGASRGLGFEIAKQFVLHGSDVMLCARNKELLYQAQKTLLMLPERKGNVFSMAAGPENMGREIYERALKQKADGGTPLEIPASLCVFLASTLSNGITGKLISALWDPWKEFALYKSELQKSDIYTLRRIIPEDRGKSWSIDSIKERRENK